MSPPSAGRTGQLRTVHNAASGRRRPGEALRFVNGALIPYLKSLAQQPGATARQRIIGEVFSGMEKSRIGDDADLMEVLDKNFTRLKST